jgi:hypothetical protein
LQFDDPKEADRESRENLAATNIASREKIPVGRNETHLKAAGIRADASGYATDSRTQISRKSLAAQVRSQLATGKLNLVDLKAKLDAMFARSGKN